MGITHKQITDDSFVIIVDGEASCKNFKELVHRGANLWPDAQPEIKDLADTVASNGGPPLQNYKEQAKDKVKDVVYRYYHHKCGHHFDRSGPVGLQQSTVVCPKCGDTFTLNFI